MALCYEEKSLPEWSKILSLIVFLITLVSTFALWEFPVYSLGLLVTILLLAGVYHLPELGIAILVNGLYLVGFLWRGFQISNLVTPLAVAICTVGLTHYVLNQGLRWRFGILPNIVVLIGLMLLVGISYSPLPSEGFMKSVRYLSMNLYIFFAIMLFTNDTDKLKDLLRMIAILGFVSAIISIVYILWTGTESLSRYALPAQNPIWFARGMGVSLLATLFLFELTKKTSKRLAYIFFISVMLFLLYTAASRGPFVALIISLFLYFFLLHWKRYGFLKKTLFVILILASFRISVAIAPEGIWNRMVNLFSGFDLTTFYRLRAFEVAKNLFLENPLKGVGTAGFDYFNALSYPHNIFLEFASELGILGVSAFLIFVIYGAYLGIKIVRNKDNPSLELNLSKIYLTLFVFSLVNSQFSGAIWGNYELWFSVAGIWTLYSTNNAFLKR